MPIIKHFKNHKCHVTFLPWAYSISLHLKKCSLLWALIWTMVFQQESTDHPDIMGRDTLSLYLYLFRLQQRDVLTSSSPYSCVFWREISFMVQHIKRTCCSVVSFMSMTWKVFLVQNPCRLIDRQTDRLTKFSCEKKNIQFITYPAGGSVHLANIMFTMLCAVPYDYKYDHI